MLKRPFTRIGNSRDMRRTRAARRSQCPPCARSPCELADWPPTPPPGNVRRPGWVVDDDPRHVRRRIDVDTRERRRHRLRVRHLLPDGRYGASDCNAAELGFQAATPRRSDCRPRSAGAEVGQGNGWRASCRTQLLRCRSPPFRSTNARLRRGPGDFHFACDRRVRSNSAENFSSAGVQHWRPSCSSGPLLTSDGAANEARHAFLRHSRRSSSVGSARAFESSGHHQPPQRVVRSVRTHRRAPKVQARAMMPRLLRSGNSGSVSPPFSGCSASRAPADAARGSGSMLMLSSMRGSAAS